MQRMNPWKTGSALSLTLLVSYSLCAAAWAIWTESAMDLLNALFHGLDFRKLQTPTPFTFGTFVYPLVIMVVWGFGVGAVYAWMYNLVHGEGRTG